MRHVAFLRGINLGNRRLKNAELREHMEALGFDAVATYQASGNVILDGAGAGGEGSGGEEREAGAALEARIEHHLRKALGFETDTFVRPMARLAELAALDALQSSRDEGLNPHVIFLKEELAGEAVEALRALETPDDRFPILGREVAWLRRGRLTDSAVTNADLQRALAATSTMRNLNTVERIVGKFGEEA
jgi:uncharacterized protein (DUF1697 family)